MSRFAQRQRLGSIPAAGLVLPRNTVLAGDCIDVMAQLPAQSVDFVLTDPPYGCRYVDRAGRTVANDNHTDWLKPAFAEVYRVMKRDTCCVSFYGWPIADEFIGAWRAAGLRIVGHIGFPKRYSSSVRFLETQHEQAYLLAKGAGRIPEQPLQDVQPWAYTGNKLHPTQKPVEALKPLIEAFSAPGELVLDPFCGSGSTLAAAQAAGRDWLGIEIDP